jgi:tetratricopeptide (TPR) repeat protein
MSSANNDNSDDFHSRIAALPRDCISCDACDTPSPSVQCERCQMTFYCNDDCRKRHAVEHRPDCHDMKEHDKQREAQTPSKEELLSAAAVDAINSDCGICLEEQMEQPVTLDCRHAFCSTCLVAWQRHTRNTPPDEYQIYDRGTRPTHVCPTCRSDSDGTVETDLMLRAQALASRAALLRHDPDAERVLLLKSLDVLNMLLEVDLPHILAYTTKVKVLGMLGEHQQVIDTINEIVIINNERLEKLQVLAGMERQIDQALAQSRMEEVERLQEDYVNYATENNCIATRIPQEDVAELWIKQAESYMELKEWDTATNIFLTKTPLTTAHDAMSPPRTRRCIMGRARCAYEMKKYENAIAASDWAIEMNRGFPGVYKYKALALKELGNLDAAIATMNRAVLYETPWDDGNRKIALAMYDELLAEKKHKKEDS